MAFTVHYDRMRSRVTGIGKEMVVVTEHAFDVELSSWE